jgi:hypothetical protein
VHIVGFPDSEEAIDEGAQDRQEETQDRMAHPRQIDQTFGAHWNWIL